MAEDEKHDFGDSLDLEKNGNLKFNRGKSNKNSLLDSFDLDKQIRENLLGAFVVTFDTRQGNMIEWQLPMNLNLDQVEFKAMASGFHLVQKDLV